MFNLSSYNVRQFNAGDRQRHVVRQNKYIITQIFPKAKENPHTNNKMQHPHKRIHTHTHKKIVQIKID